MKTNKLIAAAVVAFNNVTVANVNRFNAFFEAWFAVKKLGWTPREFRDSVLAEFDKNPLADVREDATDEQIAAAHAKKRESLSSSLTQHMPKIDPSVDWKLREAGAGRKPAHVKAGIDAKKLKAIRDALAPLNLTAEQLAAVLNPAVIKAMLA